MARVKVIISGASNTASIWPTWATIVQERYVANWEDVSCRGMGNEAIILRALRSAWEHKNCSDLLIVIMLTSIDKWDWYVDSSELIEKFNKEKHSIVTLTPNTSSGFWCTGSWFPLDKQVFQEKYYSEDYFTLRSLQLISMFKQVCDQNNWKYHILFDYPIWSMTDQELNRGERVNFDLRLINTELCNWMYKCNRVYENVFEPGLVGFLHQQSLPWFHQKYKAHPGPIGHLLFSKSHIYPVLDPLLPIKKDCASIEVMIEKMNQLWMH
jgi:hypothetical protein